MKYPEQATANGAPSRDVQAVGLIRNVLLAMLERVEEVEPTVSIEPPLEKAGFEKLVQQLLAVLEETHSLKPPEGVDVDKYRSNQKLRRHAIVETAVRDLFATLNANTPIEDPAFVKVWNFLDILSILSDEEHCDPALPFWLIEELLDSQTSVGCRKIFDFLESRRERLTARHFVQKKLVILRSCSELLRRLSRTEDAAFCGRVFIFMFQSFPLGDKSSVNLRGEYHVENITTFDQDERKAEGDTDTMEVDEPPLPLPKPSNASKKPQEQHLGPDKLYHIFWSLQESFNQPKKLFDRSRFAHFKAGLEATLSSFRAISVRHGSKHSRQNEESKRGTKRKRDESDGVGMGSFFNPKYLTSRDLFELEIADLSFRRHVLVQALIVMDFILSLSASAKKKVAVLKTQNKSVTYMDQTMSEDDIKWATDMKQAIADYLNLGHEGPYFLRMVETVLSRDKNWVRWKIENCPPIALGPVRPEMFSESKKDVQKMMANKRLRPTPLGSLPLEFLTEVDEGASMTKLEDTNRYGWPDLDDYRGKIADDDFEMQRPTDSHTKAAAMEGKYSKSWRALRIASRSRLHVFDRIDDPDKIDAIFEDQVDLNSTDETADTTAGRADFPQDKSPVVLAGSVGSGAASIRGLLLKRHPGVFANVVRHTTRAPTPSEVNGRDFVFVTPQAFNLMLGGDKLLEFDKTDGSDLGTSRAAIDAVSESGKVPLLETTLEGVRQARDMGLQSARFVLLKPPASLELSFLESRPGGNEEAGITDTLDMFDAVITDNDLDTAFKKVEGLIYRTATGGEKAQVNGSVEQERSTWEGGEDAKRTERPVEAVERKAPTELTRSGSD